MRRAVVVAALWGAFAFVAWNVMFDRHVTAAAVEFTRAQVLRHQNGETAISIHDGFSPQVPDAATRATWSVTPILAAGLVAVFLSGRRAR